MGKHHLGAFYLRKAIQENALAVTEYNSVDPRKFDLNTHSEMLGVGHLGGCGGKMHYFSNFEIGCM